MPKRRDRGTGTISERRDAAGKITGYLVFLDLPAGPGGKRRRLKRVAKTRREAQLILAELRRQQEAGQPVAPDRETVGAYLTRYLRDVVVPLREATTANTYRYLAQHLIQAFGHIPLAKLRPDAIQSLYAAKLAAGLSAGRVQGLHRFCHVALAHAVRTRVLASNPADQVQVPQPARPEPRFLTPAEAKRLLLAAQGDRLEALYLLLLSTGMRLGEVTGLRWQDVDLTAGSLIVRHTTTQIGGQILHGTPKTHRSRRPMPLTPATVAALWARRAQQAAEREAAGSEWQETDLVFTSPTGAPIRANAFREGPFARLVRRAGLGHTTPHALRHSVATILIAQGVPLKHVSEFLGHAHFQITADTYGHVSGEHLRSVSDVLSDQLGYPIGYPDPKNALEPND